MKESIVIGAGPAGLSAGLTLARARRSTLVVDAGQQSNLAAATIGGLLGHDRRPPAEYYAAARADLTAYPSVELRSGEAVTAVRQDGGGFVVTFGDGSSEHARTMILAPGMDYRIPPVPGLAERWGGSVFHCPFCHGWELRERPMAVLATGAVGVHGALNLRGWTDSVTLLTNGTPLTDGQRDLLTAGGVAWDERPVAALDGPRAASDGPGTGFDGPGAGLSAVVFADGGALDVTAMLVKSTLYQRGTLARDLGATLTAPDEMLSVEAIAVDPMGRTGVPGLYAAGDAATPVPPSMAAAVASGYLAGAAAAVELAAGY
ncbi:hypothetical protein Val02_27990 [Virgisporangium aliadipatigenens]|uniref:FAD/NAD(P)-binding domain-containing protein n=1 Tax=Virgisporangium aliadipatigenens TaxID=741659 RepID=A0A8J4DQN4_9ACTN|nr:NAD(P)/FAD-dependent oxidoreductase [Virgisporangium aliadipatigenens]GIJ45913.1 hypothetical protein Val02_27990 [Virgisporangium aliadipatigenens]